MSQFNYNRLVFRQWSLLYGFVCLLEIIAEFLLGGFQVDFGYQLRLLTKPLLMPILILALYKSLSPNLQQVHWSLLAGLLFSWAGDVLLMPPLRNFVLGLVAFLIAHLFYIRVFSVNLSRKVWRLQHIVPGAILFLAVFYKIVPHAGDLAVPVIIYAVIICTMMTTAFVRHLTVGFPLAALGSFLFVVSDFVLAWALFVNSFELNRIITMSFYVFAQWLIVYGVLISAKGY